MARLILKAIHSGGQNGADLTALQVAKALGLETGGIAPKGWRICNADGSDGSNPDLAKYGLVEHASRDYRPRTISNVQNTDGTVVFGKLDSAGSKVAIQAAKIFQKPLITNPDSAALRDWLIKHKIKTLNVAGNRPTINPGIEEQVRLTLTHAILPDYIAVSLFDLISPDGSASPASYEIP